jgi:hypothetical protein
MFLIKWLVLTSSSGITDNHSGLMAFEILKKHYARGYD